MIANNVLATGHDDRFMQAALEEARAAAERGEVPVGAVLVLNEEIIARAGIAPSPIATPPPMPKSSRCAKLRRASGTIALRALNCM